MKRIVKGIVSSFLLIGLLSACGTSDETTNGSNTGVAKEKDKKVLIMGTSADYPPFEYIDTTKGEEIIGFDVDIAKAVTEKLGYDLKIVDMDFNGLIPAIEAKKVDFVLAGMSSTPEREKSVDFSQPYYLAKNMIITTKNSNIQSLEDIKGKTIGVQVGTVQEAKAKEIKETININIQNRNRIPEIIQEIKSKRFDAAIMENVVAVGFISKDQDLTGFEIPDPKKKGSAIVLPKGSLLKKDFDRVIDEMKQSGELDKLIAKWFGAY